MVRESLVGSQNLPEVSREKSAMACFFNDLHDKTVSNLVYFATAYVLEQCTLVRCSLTRKIIMFNFSCVPCIIF
jgi:hypothetical protein